MNSKYKAPISSKSVLQRPAFVITDVILAYRLSREKQKNVNILVQEYAGAGCDGGCWVNEKPYLDYWMYADATDHWKHEGKVYNNRWLLYIFLTGRKTDYTCVASYNAHAYAAILSIEGV